MDLAINLTFVGITVVFSALIILAGIISLFKVFFAREDDVAGGENE